MRLADGGGLAYTHARTAGATRMEQRNGPEPSGAAGPFGLPTHPLRPAVLGEVHSRPFHLVPTPRVILQLEFLKEGADFADDLAMLGALARSRGVSGPGEDAPHFLIGWGAGRLRWERHSEFSSWRWDAPADVDYDEPCADHPFGGSFRAPGLLISAVRLDLREPAEGEAALGRFDETSLCYSTMAGGAARGATDFRQDAQGLTRILVIDDGLGPARAGALTQRLMEIETYRTLALLGLPTARAINPEIRRIESDLQAITNRLGSATELGSHALLDAIIALASELEAGAVASLYRFGASRAYAEIVNQRLQVIGEQPIPGHETWGAFLLRRMGPAMRTCQAVEERQADLSEKLARASNLLRTRVDVELERQNQTLLESMDRRARLQLRLQQTVEGLSVAAVSYYVLGLVRYLAEGGAAAGARIEADLVTAFAVIPVVLGIWWIVRRIRRKHAER